MKQNKITAVIVTYNRKELLIKCINALLKQSRALDAIFIIDNKSTDGTPELLLANNFINSLPIIDSDVEKLQSSEFLTINNDKILINYTRKKENDGGAGGFNFGMKQAIHLDYDWIWVMDDDAIAEEKALENLSLYTEDKIAGLCSTVINVNGDIDLNHRVKWVKKRFKVESIPIPKERYQNEKIIEIDTASYVGFLINSMAIKKAGYPRKEYFIFYDDAEHSFRLQKYGPILLVPDSKIRHLAPIYNGIVMIDDWKIYYDHRNRLKTIADHFGEKYILISKLKLILKIAISFIKGQKKYSAMLLNALKDYKKL